MDYARRLAVQWVGGLAVRAASDAWEAQCAKGARDAVKGSTGRELREQRQVAESAERCGIRVRPVEVQILLEGFIRNSTTTGAATAHL